MIWSLLSFTCSNSDGDRYWITVVGLVEYNLDAMSQHIPCSDWTVPVTIHDIIATAVHTPCKKGVLWGCAPGKNKFFATLRQQNGCQIFVCLVFCNSIVTGEPVHTEKGWHLMYTY